MNLMQAALDKNKLTGFPTKYKARHDIFDIFVGFDGLNGFNNSKSREFTITYEQLMEEINSAYGDHCLAFINGVFLKLYAMLKVFPDGKGNNHDVIQCIKFNNWLNYYFNKTNETNLKLTKAYASTGLYKEKVDDDWPGEAFTIDLDWTIAPYFKGDEIKICGIYCDYIISKLTKDTIWVDNIEIKIDIDMNIKIDDVLFKQKADVFIDMITRRNAVGDKLLAPNSILINIFEKYIEEYNKDVHSDLETEGVDNSNLLYYIRLSFIYAMSYTSPDEKLNHVSESALNFCVDNIFYTNHEARYLYAEDDGQKKLGFKTPTHEPIPGDDIAIITRPGFIRKSCLLFKRFYYVFLHNNISYIF